MRLFRPLPAVLILLCALALGACSSKEADTALITAPAVGDVYAAQLSEFSGYGFTDEDGKDIDPAYGLMKVVALEDSGVVVITENHALSSQTQSRKDLRGDMTDVVFDENERIAIAPADLRKAYDDGLIYAVRRPSAP
ncbi:hypothetical protein [Luteimonas deserti]|uniref:Uncharacterized protein n=1 Tax=Luteimonas deserti TaxID=2752306 RepID=A0A7Z0QRF9_9GAMM|nr:hypothetical protein [Luteimonas deserti]NYZ63474.1 hypothetical protein [Luteimonas deserti]